MSDRDNHAYNEWAAEHLLDRDDETAGKAERTAICTVTTEQMIAAWAAERAAVEERSAIEAAAERAVIRDGWRSMFTTERGTAA
jgi:hypothetical protein